MTAPALSSAVQFDGPSRPINNMEVIGMSPGKNSKRQALTYRQHFAACWSRFIRENFDSPEHAGLVFGVDASTARNWFEGSHAPSGFAVGYAYTLAPDAASRSLGGTL